MKEDLVDGECDGAETLWVELHMSVPTSKLIIGVFHRLTSVKEEVGTHLHR